MRPPMIPTPGSGVDAVNFRSLKESESVDISRGGPERDVTERGDVDPFGEFNSGIPLYLGGWGADVGSDAAL
jgi:protein-serine/threonine kinase